MDILIKLMIYSGSALMVVNIVRYFLYARKMLKIERAKNSYFLLYTPFFLLIFFLCGYLAVGIFGDPDIIMSGILFGGSIFVFIILMLTYRITGLIIEDETALRVRYDEMKKELDGITQNSLAVFRVNLTKDVIEEAGGNDLYDEDMTAASFSELMDGREKYMIFKDGEDRMFLRDGLIKKFREGHNEVSEVILVRRKDGNVSFVKMRATLAEQPSTGDIIAFMTERPYNDEMVNKTILDVALSDQYDMIAFIANGSYNMVARGGAAYEKGGIVPKESSGVYHDYIMNTVLPAVKDGGADPQSELCIDCVNEKLTKGKKCEFNAECEINGETCFKRFTFFPVNTEARFFIMLVSDTTAIHKERTEQNLRLEEALAEARRANRAKTRFFSNMSHDLRTPMNAIVGFTGIASKCDDMQKIKEYINKIDSAGKHMLDIINEVLEMSRIESGKTELNITGADLSAEFSGLNDIYSVLMAEKHIDFKVELKNVSSPRVMCDIKLLDRVMLNLISNAYKYTPDGGKVSVTLTQISADNVSASFEISVKDNGIGMTEEFAQKVFMPFERERNEAVEGIQGTGLGMAITKNMIDLMGGTIGVKTAPGKGTEFTVGFRFELDRAEDEEKAEDTENRDIDCEKYRILIVDDNEINREIAQFILDERGFMTEEAENGKQAYDMIADSPDGYYDLLLTDIQMPVMNGYEEAKAVRALDGKKAAMPIIAITANVFAEDVKNQAESGINGHILKPFNAEDLIKEILRLLPDKN